MKQKIKKSLVITGGGTGGHIYPGIAVADKIREIAKDKNLDLDIYWIGNKLGMDKTIVEKNLISQGGSINSFFGIPSGKLRRYFSFKNFIDLFKIIAGFFSAVHVLRKIKPVCLFSKGGFVSVPPCAAAKLLKIPYFTHECDFTPGLATKLNSSGAKNIFLSYSDTKKYFNEILQKKCIVTGNPVRPVFYNVSDEVGRKFLNLTKENQKPILLVLGGSLGALQINNLVIQNLDWLKERFIVVHQTGSAFAKSNPEIMQSADDSYKPYDFIYEQMPSVIKCADIVLSRSGANSLWECATLEKPMILVPLCGNGSRGDQVDNANYFKEKNAALVLLGKDADGEHLKSAMEIMLDKNERNKFSANCKKICANQIPVQKIAELILGEFDESSNH